MFLYQRPFPRSLILYLLFVFLLVGQVLYLWSLPYTTSQMEYFSIEKEKHQAAPAPNFSLGDIDWNVENYQTAQELEPFRRYFQKHCNNLLGIKAAVCLSDNFLQSVPFGEPENDMFKRTYQPLEAFEQTINGAAGNCVTYSASIATILLSMGVPARVVQIIPQGKKGHNILEVWDKEKGGWILFDPLNGGVMTEGEHYVSGFEAMEQRRVLFRVRAENRPDDNGFLKEYYQGETPFDGALTYPEPYLYTRIGQPQSLPIYRAKFAVFGNDFYFLGFVQNILRGGIMMCFLGLLGISLPKLLKKPYVTVQVTVQKVIDVIVRIS